MERSQLEGAAGVTYEAFRAAAGSDVPPGPPRRPHEAPTQVLQDAGVELGANYEWPIISLQARLLLTVPPPPHPGNHRGRPILTGPTKHCHLFPDLVELQLLSKSAAAPSHLLRSNLCLKELLESGTIETAPLRPLAYSLLRRRSRSATWHTRAG